MIDLNQILYTTTRDHVAQAFSCVASLATVTEDGAVPQPIVAVGVGATKDAAQDAAQLAMLKKLCGAAAAAPTPKAAPAAKKETP